MEQTLCLCAWAYCMAMYWLFFAPVHLLVFMSDAAVRGEACAP